MANSSINLVDLDFAGIKANIKNYLRNQPQFKDYDYDGSTMAVLIDVLAYNTFKQSFYTNMLMAESFLDSAQLRGSVVSHAKELNYTPRSARSSKARVRVNFEATSESQPYVIAKGLTLSAIVKSSNFNFSIPETLSVSSANNSFSFETDIYEGVFVQDSYTFVQTGETIPRFRITNKNVDTTSLTVTVFEDGDTEGETYSLKTSLLDLGFDDAVFFLQCDENEFFEIYFGDNVLGKSPSNYATVVLNYRIAQGKVADGALQYVLNFNPTGQQNELLSPVTVTTIDVSRGGESVETTESIRYYAPKAFQVQERTVSAQDYEVALKMQFPEINAVNAFGGEEVDPPMFGRVFVAVDISNVEGFPDQKKKQYYDFIKKRAPFSIEPIFIEPEFSYLAIDAIIRYNINVTKVNPDTIKTLITNTILSFRNDFLDDFNVIYRDSKLQVAIDDTDISIISSILDTKLYKKVDITPGTPTDIVLKYDCAIMNTLPAKAEQHNTSELHAFYSSTFRLQGRVCRWEDDGEGVVWLVQTDNTSDSKITDMGTIDYTTGIVTINDAQVDTFLGEAVKFYVRPADADITAKNNTILTIEEDQINLTIEQLRE